MSGKAFVFLCAIATGLAFTSAVWAGPTLTNLVSFDDGADGGVPQAGLLADSAGDFYGTTLTSGGAAGGDGTVFELAAGTHALSTLATFNLTNGKNPYGTLLADANGNMYGTTEGGGSGQVGTVYEVAAGTHELSTLATFNGSNGNGPLGGLIADSTGNLYGTTQLGGADNAGTVFEIATGTHTLSTLVTFNGTNGGGPTAGLVMDAAGNMYGTTETGGTGVGTVFELAAGNHALSTLVTFNLTNGGDPIGGLIVDAKGDLFGTTYGGGPSDTGTVFEVTAGTHTLKTLAIFNATNECCPYSGLIEDVAGNLYGTAEYQGLGGTDCVFEIAAGTDALSTIVTFNAGDRSGPVSNLIADSAGNLYGTTYFGGTNGDGTVFELSGSGFVVPEPATGSLLMFACAGLLMRKGKHLPRF